MDYELELDACNRKECPASVRTALLSDNRVASIVVLVATVHDVVITWLQSGHFTRSPSTLPLSETERIAAATI